MKGCPIWGNPFFYLGISIKQSSGRCVKIESISIMTKTFGEKVIEFNRNLQYNGELPDGFRVMNPFLDNPETMEVMAQFYNKYYGDNKQRRFIVGINPGRHGAGTTGVPFTDTKRLSSVCGIEMQSAHTHEVSSVFVYDLIEQYGGAEAFYSDFYINSPFPLAITRKQKNGNWNNANYYDDRTLYEMVEDYMIESMHQHIDLGLACDEVFVMGKKNSDYIKRLNKKAQLFDKITVLEHPRYVQQYKSKEKQFYIDKYLAAFAGEEI